ncbi:MAG: alkaline phosphatase family protein [Saprospiraceae bacterium]|nr:alkaline phosphatase family protein [Saprospiraceae bacterium]
MANNTLRNREPLIACFFIVYSVALLVTPLFGQKEQTSRIFKLAFGSCGDQNKPQPALKQAAEQKPDYFIFLGDNIYGDTYDTTELLQKYQLLASKLEFQHLQRQTKILATWDDHDYGWNDSGRHYPLKHVSKRLFLDFFREPEASDRRNHEGIYTSYLHPVGDKIIQIILLDTRTFRDNLIQYGGEKKDDPSFFYQPDYSPHSTSDSTLLGPEQWKWLENILKVKADLRIIATSTQFGISYNGYEAWTNFPHEQKRMASLIEKCRAEGVIFISGDVHYAEISKKSFPGLYPLYDFTSSGITSTWYFATPNENRIEGPVMDNHFGLLTVDFASKDPLVRMECIDVYGNTRFEFTIPIQTLKFKD